ncbi:hypothetical protein Poli38472_011220 [Pythium oligandrum]|uniref:Uncharacterized protein n=1 Tax=Pythium oligandrum TaxID=41045 RepID=A0A8K1CQD4_PYTOL|nr:hypothetical protein Poli38472_011220 [Pythium oligandrum]|eukprot:TMW67600.1 hypothetical protein Poli38472_011220 [Pythium oligandrum]
MRTLMTSRGLADAVDDEMTPLRYRVPQETAMMEKSTWGFLDLWWEKLTTANRRLAMCFRKHMLDDVTPQYKGLKVPMLKTNTVNKRQMWADVREALELVTLVAIVDPSAWTHMVKRWAWAYDVDNRQVEVRAPGSRVRRAFGEMVAMLFDDKHPSTRSTEFRATYAKILEKAMDPAIRAQCEKRSIPVEIKFRNDVEEVLTAFLDVAKDTYEQQKRLRELGSCSSGCPFVFDSLKLTLCDQLVSNEFVSRRVQSLVGSLPLDHVKLMHSNGEFYTWEPRYYLRSIVRDVLQATASSASEQHITLHLDSSVSLENLSGIFSALALPTPLRKLTLTALDNGSEATMREVLCHMWRWIGYGLFSKFSQINIETLKIDEITFERSSVNAMEQAIQATNPFALLWHQKDPQAPMVARMRKDKKLQVILENVPPPNPSNDLMRSLGVEIIPEQPDFQRHMSESSSGSDNDMADDSDDLDEELLYSRSSESVNRHLIRRQNPDLDSDESDSSDYEERYYDFDEDEGESYGDSDSDDEEAEARIVAKWKEESATKVHCGDTFPIMMDNPNATTVDVLIPGFGISSVEREDVDIFPSASMGFPSSKTPSLRKLRIRMLTDQPHEKDGLAHFLRLVGRTLTHLYIEDFNCEYNGAEIFQTIVSCCPDLECVSLEGFLLGSMQLVIDAFEVSRCKWSKLRFVNMNGLEEASIVAFAKVLGDSSSHMARTLRHFVLQRGGSGIEFNTWTVFREMLQTNRFLRFLHIPRPRDPSGGPSNPTRFPEEDELVMVPKSPLPLSCKLAFLSVVQVRGGEEQSIHQLDSFTLDRIFNFAATGITRTVILTTFRR